MIKIFQNLKKEKFFLIVLTVIFVLLRLYKITNPIADWHAFRQADTASVTRQFQKNGINLLIPKYHDLGSIQSGLDNPEGYRMVEFPIINSLIAFVLRLFPFLDLVLLSRISSIFVSIGTLLSIYFLVELISGKRQAILSALFFTFLPFSIYYSRAILPEPYLLFFSTFSIFQFVLFTKKQKLKNYFLSLIALILSFLLKPYVVFLFPVYLVLIFQNKKLFKDFKIYLYPILAVIPFLLWRKWIANFPEGIPASSWLLNGNEIRLRPAWFRWLFYERLSKLILGFFGLIFLFANLIKIKTKDFYFYFFWWLGILIYLIVFATGNVQHDYYQNLLIPILSISLGRGVLIFFQFFKTQKLAYLLTITVSVLTLFFSWREVKGYFNVNHWDFVKAGKKADQVLPKDALVIAPNFGDTYFLFQTNRTGWPIGFNIEDKIAKGAQYYINTNFDDETNDLIRTCKIIEKTQEFVIIDLRNCDFKKEKESETLFTAPTENDVFM